MVLHLFYFQKLPALPGYLEITTKLQYEGQRCKYLQLYQENDQPLAGLPSSQLLFNSNK